MTPSATIWLKRFGLGVLSLMAISLLLGIAIFRTETGARWALGQLQTRVPGTLEIRDLSGTLWSGLRIANFKYQYDLLILQGSTVLVRVDWPQLASGKFSVRELHAASITYQDDRPNREAPQPFELPFRALPIDINVDSVNVEQLNFILRESRLEVNRISLEGGILSETHVRVDRAAAQTGPVGVAIQSLDANLIGDIPLSLNVDWNLTSGTWSGEGTFDGSLADLIVEHSVQGQYPARFSGRVSILNRLTPEVVGTITGQQWHIDKFSFEGSSVEVNGTMDEYFARFETAVVLPESTQAQVTGSAQGNLQGLTEFDIEAQSASGTVSSNGSMNWLPSLEVNADVQAIDFDPAIVVGQFPGRLGAAAEIQVVGKDLINILSASVSGTLNEAVVTASGAGTITPSDIRCDDCFVEVGPNRLVFNGVRSIDETALTFSVNAPNLKILWPDISGNLVGDGFVGGASASPYFSGEIVGRELVFNDWSADELVLSSRDSTVSVVDLTINAANVSAGDDKLGAFSIQGRGATDDLDFNVSWSREELALRVAGRATTDDLGFKSVFSLAEFTEPNTGTWALQDSLTLTIQGDDVAVSPHQWSNGIGTLRVDHVSRQSGATALLAEVSRFPLSTANNWLPENYQLRGTANSTIDLSQNNGLWSGSVGWHQNDTVLAVTDAQHGTTDVIFSEVSADAKLVDGRVEVSAALSIEPGVVSSLQLQLDKLAADANMEAELRVNGKDLAWISALAPMIDNIAGTIAATINADGIIASPRFSGSLNWQDGSLAVPALNVPLSEIEVSVVGADNGAATMQGSARAGDGELSISGKFADVLLSTRSAELTINGAGAELINWPDYRVWVTPNINITGDTDGWNFDGDVAVPRAEIEIRELPEDAVLLSDDVTVLGRVEDSEPATQISGDSNLILGEAVHVRAFGLDTKLRGDLRIRMRKDRPARATGEVELVDGTFTAYGQKLTIREGTLTFTGPLEEPLVDVRAVREIDSLDGRVTAGIHLRGRGQSLTSTVYSDPVLPEADALSYLIIGRPLNQATESEGNELSGAAIALGARQAAKVTDQLGQAFGLDQLALTGGGRSTTSLVAGKQVNNRLHARYAYGVFSRLGTLLLRYRLSQRLTLEAGAGEEQSIDLLYQVEKQ